MRINLTSVLVDDQDKALRFYTEVLGFVKKTEIPMGDHRWLTVVSAEEPDGVELLLEPDEHPAAKPFKDALVADGIPFTSFAVPDVHAETVRLRKLGVTFTQEPTADGTGDHRRPGRHLRQPDPDRQHVNRAVSKRWDLGDLVGIRAATIPPPPSRCFPTCRCRENVNVGRAREGVARARECA